MYRSMWLIKIKLYNETEEHLNWCLKFIEDEHINARILNGIVYQLASVVYILFYKFILRLYYYYYYYY
jgi:hypothetical protein